MLSFFSFLWWCRPVSPFPFLPISYLSFTPPPSLPSAPLPAPAAPRLGTISVSFVAVIGEAGVRMRGRGAGRGSSSLSSPSFPLDGILSQLLHFFFFLFLSSRHSSGNVLARRGATRKCFIVCIHVLHPYCSHSPAVDQPMIDDSLVSEHIWTFFRDILVLWAHSHTFEHTWILFVTSRY